MLETKKLENKKYVLTVEGQTEKIYFNWLQEKINNCADRKYNVLIDSKVEQSPRSFYKSITAKANPEVFHICDVESTSKEHIDKFERILSEMKESKKQKNIKYILGYSNFTFELWLILHKQNCNGPLTKRQDYITQINKCFCNSGERFENLEQFKQKSSLEKSFKQLSLDDVKKAIERAEKITKANEQNHKQLIKHSGYSYYRENPALSIHEVVKRILVECGVF